MKNDDKIIGYISLYEAAKLTNYSQEYISLLCRQKKIEATKIGRNWVIKKEWVEDYINKTNGSGKNVIPVKIKKNIEIKDDAIILKERITKNEAKCEVDSVETEKMFERKDTKDNIIQLGTEKEIITDKIIPVKEKMLPEVYAEKEEDFNSIQSFVSGKIKKQLSFYEKFIAVSFATVFVAFNFVIFQFWSPVLNDSLLKVHKNFNIEKVANSIHNIFYLKNNIKIDKEKEIGRVAGVKDSIEYKKESTEISIEEDSKNGMVVIPLDGDIKSQENIDLINKINSSFSDDVVVDPFEDGVSGVITSSDNSEDNYLYLMVPISEE
ncbi:MAG: helix-turn-helix domain-containing protein [Patescibacteria group bacterium]|nr:helix-turn-helix domain-containing protein [Patescibacteria group bacterium]